MAASKILKKHFTKEGVVCASLPVYEKLLLFVQSNCHQISNLSLSALLYLFSFKEYCIQQILMGTTTRSITFQ